MTTHGVPSYGLDAPGIVYASLVGGGLGVLAGLILAAAWHRGLLIGCLLALISAAWLGQGVLMLHYATRGKFKVRDRILAGVTWRGQERVLDIGTGRGLLLIGAAKRLHAGSAVGIDIWSAEDLSGNTPGATLRNAELEGVLARVELRSDDARAMSFASASFDVVLSNLCLHNIRSAEGRQRACSEIARVLKPGGVALISDYTGIEEYGGAFARSGCMVTAPARIHFFPPLKLLSVRKGLEPESSAA